MIVKIISIIKNHFLKYSCFMQMLEFISIDRFEELMESSKGIVVKEIWRFEQLEWEKNAMTLGDFPEKDCKHILIGDLTIPESGQFIYYPWSNTVIISFGEFIYRSLITVRNMNKISQEEQRKLFDCTISVVGLSVGFQVVKALVMSNLCGRIRIADFDEIEITNLNRLDSGILSVGNKKSEIAYRWIVEQNPFIKVDIFTEGVNSQNMDEFLQTEDSPINLLIDECDSLIVKIQLRKAAKLLKIPVVMHTSDRGMLDIENFSIGDSEFEFSFLNYSHLTSEEIQKNAPMIIADICDLRNASVRSKESFSIIGKGLRSWPQLAEDVISGGGNVATAARLILLGQRLKSQRILLNPESFLEVIN